MKIIHFFTCLTDNSAKYADNLYDNLQKVTSNKYRKKFTAIYKHGTINEFTKNWENRELYFDYINFSPQSNGFKHSQLLNQIRNIVPSNSDYIVICDCDVMVLMKNWDNIIIKYLEDKPNVVSVSTPKFCGVFSVYFTVFNGWFFRKYKLDFSNGINSFYNAIWHKIDSPQDAICYKKKIGDKIVLDTGNRIAKQITNIGYKYKLTGVINNNEFYWGKKYYVSHLGGSWKKSFNADIVQDWIKMCNKNIS